MPGLKFRVLLDSEKNEEIFRDIVISENEDFESFFQEILNSYGFKGDQMASFYVSNENWDKGEEISLTCDPLWEAATFSSWKHDAMGLIDKLNCPITLLQAEYNSTARGNGPMKLMQQDKNGVHRIVKGSSHFLPMEFPQTIIKEINSLQRRINNEKK